MKDIRKQYFVELELVGGEQALIDVACVAAVVNAGAYYARPATARLHLYSGSYVQVVGDYKEIADRICDARNAKLLAAKS